MSEWLQDLRYGARMILKRPGTSAIAIVALALGIGLTTMMFSVVEGVLLRGLPFEHSERVVVISRATVQQPQQRGTAYPAEILDWRTGQSAFEAIGGYTQTTVTLADDTAFAERLSGVRITPNLLSILRVKPVVGRDFTEADAAPGAPPTVLIAYRTWRDRYSSSQSALGTTVRLNGVATTIVGVMPEKFGFPEAQEIWLPVGVTPGAKRTEGQRLRAIARLKEGSTIRSAQTEMTAIAARLAAAYPVDSKDIIARVSPFLDDNVPARIRTTFYAMMGAVLGVMLIACVNVTNLQLARAAERGREYAIRSALGSGRWRIVRQSLAEGLLLSAAGAAIGVALAQSGTVYFMGAIADTRPPFWIDVRLDTTVLAFVTLITVAATIVSSLVPGLRVAGTDAAGVLKDDARGMTSVRMGRFGRWLVVVEVAVSCVLLVVSGLMIRTVVMSSRIEYPFPTRDVFFASASFDQRTHPDAAAVTRAQEALEADLARLPGARHVTLASSFPGNGQGSRFVIDGQPAVPEEQRPSAAQIAATPGYFDTFAVSARQGRLFTRADAATSEPVVVVDEAFVARHLTGGPVIGRRIRFGDEKQPWRTVIGVLPTLSVQTDAAQLLESAYVPLAQSGQRGFSIFVRTAGAPSAIAGSVRAALAGVSRETPLSNANPLDRELWRRGWAQRLFGGLFLLFGASALLMAAAGLYGVMSFTVRRRTHEIGVRMALGASRRGVLWMVIWQGVWRVAVGVALGLWPGWFLATEMRALLQNANPADPFVHSVTAATLLLSGVAASLVPALRASSIDPLTALRE